MTEKHQMKKSFLFLLVSLFLFSCAPQPEPAVQEVVEQPQPASPYDGNWEGTGTTKDGKEFIISFQVQGGILTSIKYQYEGTVRHTPCFITHYSPIPETERPEIKDDGFAIKLGRDLDISAKFTSADSVEGHLFADVYYRYELCNGVFDLDWSAQKQAEQPQQAVAEKPVVKKSPLEIFVQIIIFGLSNGAVLALNAIGVTLIYGTVRTLNLAHGDVFALSTVAVTSIVNLLAIQANWSPGKLFGGLLLAGVVAIAVGAGLSMGVNQLGFKPFRGHSRLAPLIATLGLSFILFQGALVWRTFQASWSPGEHRSVPGLPEVPTDGIPNLLPNTDLVQALHLPVQIVFRFSDFFVLGMALLFVGLATWFLYRSSTGKALRALAQNQILAQMVGINVDSTINRAFAVGGALAGAAAFIFALYYGRPFGTHGAQSGLLAFTAALLGGIGSPVGALVSSLSIGIVSSLSDYYLSAQWTSVITLGLLIALIAWRPHGLTVSGGADSDSAQVRDSVILSAAGSSPRVKRWVTASLVALALIPIIQYAFGLGGQIILRTIVIFILLSLGLNIALGFTGLLDFGYAASFGLGAYTGALVLSHGGNFWLALIASAFVSALLGLVKGLLASRIRDDFLAVATLALGLLVRQLIINFDFTGGVNGISGLTALHFPVSFLLLPTMNFYLVFGFVVLGTLLSMGLAVSRLGRAWIASSEDETAALASGVDVPRARIFALILSSVIAGVAGVLHAGTITYVDPELFSFYISSLTLTMVILGGAGSVPGMLIGAATIILYDKVIVPQIADWVALLWPRGLMIGSVPDIRGASYFNFGIALYLTVLIRARRKNKA
jgi:branched-chain amino acid transport system permease protein